ncbi:hypothetical protein CFP65_7582 [Kitasatospora sp. MMS16-BH015]|uniref:hypothetical protein n=1 Tax=Kitasatospora sp. MMS16-BH015 TaxID=2018025 RepID=UPI000CA2206D|nr:hypothetical protein [Kitasatospora sp. MMS16-BH015]AUG82153.1 hypothetical protein CFP65_7582 [Kitasatospora sp. MMS16-BH015]
MFCPTCKGTGYTDMFDPVTGRPYPDLKMPCDRCDATGHAPERRRDPVTHRPEGR